MTSSGGRVYTLEDAKIELQTLQQERDILSKILTKLKAVKQASVAVYQPSRDGRWPAR